MQQLGDTGSGGSARVATRSCSCRQQALPMQALFQAQTRCAESYQCGLHGSSAPPRWQGSDVDINRKEASRDQASPPHWTEHAILRDSLSDQNEVHLMQATTVQCTCS